MTRLTTMLLAGVVFVAGTIIGARLLLAGTEAAEPTASCRPSVVKAGSRLNSNAVRVNVFNASNRSGLANRVQINLQKNGFLGGQIGNSTSATKPSRVAILTPNRDDPRVKLVASQFRGKVSYAKLDMDITGGVTVVVGDNYTDVKKKARTSIKTDRDIRVCIPVVLS